MKEGDKDGVFHSMEKALVYVDPFCSLPVLITDCPISLPGIAQHVPWAYKFVRSLPTMGTNLGKFIGFGMGHAIRRFGMEVKEKDLFYYMVRVQLSAQRGKATNQGNSLRHLAVPPSLTSR